MNNFSIAVKTFHSQTVEFEVNHLQTIASLKSNLEQRLGIAAAQQRLIFSCRELSNDQSLENAGVGPNAVIFLVLSLRGIREVVIRTLNDREFVLSINSDATVYEIKQRIQEKTAIKAEKQRLIANGRELIDGENLSHHFGSDHDRQIVLHVLVRSTRSSSSSRNKEDWTIRENDNLLEKSSPTSQRDFYSPNTVLGSPVCETPSSFLVPPNLSRSESFQEQAINSQLLQNLAEGDDYPFADLMRSKSSEIFDLEPWNYNAERESGSELMDIGTTEDILGGVELVTPRRNNPDINNVVVKIEPPASENVWSNSAPTLQSPVAKVAAPILTPQQKLQMQMYQKEIALAAAAAAAAASTTANLQQEFKNSFASSAQSKPSSTGLRRVKQDLTPEERLQKRLLKNRLSAERSRQRKQAYVEELEFKLSVSKSENTQLRDRVRELECSLAALSLLVQPSMLEPYPILSSSLQKLPISSAAH